MSNPLSEYFRHNKGRLIHKWLDYFAIYHRHFKKFRNKKPTVIEFGVSHGGSLQMWKSYFGPGARIFGVDKNPKCKVAAEPGIKVLIGDQADPAFLKKVCGVVGPIDILIDDGGHRMEQQIATFEGMYRSVKIGGIYLVEDLQTSYLPRYGGGLRRPGTMIEYAKTLIDRMNGWWAGEKGYFTRTAYSMTLYGRVLVIEKANMSRGRSSKTGRPSW